MFQRVGVLLAVAVALLATRRARAVLLLPPRGAAGAAADPPEMMVAVTPGMTADAAATAQAELEPVIGGLSRRARARIIGFIVPRVCARR